jgi:hypothetical protein
MAEPAGASDSAMTFRQKFLGATHPFGEHRFGVGRDGFEPRPELLAELQLAIETYLRAAAGQLANAPNAKSFAAELNYQLISMNSSRIGTPPGIRSGTGPPQSSLETADTIQRYCNYLGSQLIGIRWAAERLMSERSLRTVSKHMESLHRQDFQTGIRLYETKEYSLARESLDKALGSTHTNYFVHQYLGFIAVHEDMPADTANHFEAAFKHAETENHQALALSHLARCRYVCGMPAEAAEFARKAAELDASAGFWYEYAIYSALSGNFKSVLPAIVNAMQNDWVYWAIAIAEPLLDCVRGELSSMMNDLREQRSAKPRKLLDQARELVEGMQKLGGLETAPIEKELTTLERRYAENNIYQFRDLTTDADQMIRRITKTAREAVGDKVSARKRGLKKNDLWRENQVDHLSSPVQKLRQEQRHLGATFKAWNAGCTTYTLIWCAYMAAVVAFVTGPTWKEIYVVPYVLSFVVPFVFPACINGFNYYITVRRPRGDLDDRIKVLERQVNPAVEEIQRVYQERKESITKELRALEELLERIRKVDAA